MDYSLQIKSNVDIQALNTLGVPCIAEYFVEIATQKELHNFIAYVRQKPCPFPRRRR